MGNRAGVLVVACLVLACNGSKRDETDTSTAGSGGACAQPPSCNWCDGGPLQDDAGCIVGWRCANGDDPCKITPCKTSSDCTTSQTCSAEGICAPKTKCETSSESMGQGDGGSPPAYDIVGHAHCTWQCDDGQEFGSVCYANASDGYCECYTAQPYSRTVLDGADCHGSASDDACWVGQRCCEFPW